MSLLGDHLCVPFGLAMDNSRDFILDDPLDDDGREDISIPVAPEFTLDYMYDTMVLYPKKGTKINNNKTHKKKR